MAFVYQDPGNARRIAGPTRPPSPAAAGATARRGWVSGYRWLLSREAVVHMVLIAVMIAVVWGSIYLHLAQQRQEVEVRTARDSSNLAHTAAESIGQTIAGVDDALRFMEAVYSSDPKRFDIGAWAGRVNRTRGVALEFAIINRDGMLAASSLGAANTPVDFSDREFFKAHVRDVLDRLFISQPILGRTSGRWSVIFTRKIVAADGWFMGVMAASVDPLWLTRLHKTLDIGRGSLLLVGTDGLIRGFSSGAGADPATGVGRDISQSTLLSAASKADRGTVGWLNPMDGTRQTASFQNLAGYSSIVAVSLNTDDVFAPYQHYAQQYEIFGGGLTLLILITGCLLLNNTRHLLVSRRVLKDTIDTMSQGIIMVDAQGRIPVFNRRASDLLHLPHYRTGTGLTLKDIADAQGQGSRIGSIDRHDAYFWHPTDSDTEVTYEEIRKDGQVLEIHTHSLADGGSVRTYTDITARKNAEAQIIHLALHDALTGLPNRRLFADLLVKAIERAGQGEKGCAVLWVDLDKFKFVNDLYGHRFGDRVLLRVVERLRGVVGSGDIVARFGGDEFCILQNAIENPTESESLARQLIGRLSEPYQIDGHEVLLSASIGMALCPAHGTSADQLLSNADTALYRAKEDGRGRFRQYDPAMDVAIAERRLLEQDLRAALALEQLVVFYQPIFDSTTTEVTGFEALVRWPHPTRGDVSADEFIPIAEESGLIVSLGQWVMQTAFAEATRWPRSLRVSVNLSPKQFSVSDIPGRIAATLAKTGLPPERLTLELTEGVLIDNSDRALSAINALKAIGVQIALDDFGTGYSSLSYLRRFPFDSIKIDKSFIRTLCDDEGSRTIVQAILSLAGNLKLKVVAEGVENHEQLAWLRRAGCPEVQGFLMSRAMPSHLIDIFLEESRARALPDN